MCPRVCLVAQSCPTLFDPVGCGLWAAGLLCPWDLTGENTWEGCHALLQGIFPTRKLNPHLTCLLHCRQVLYPLSHLGSPNQVYWTSFNVFLTALSRCCEHQLYSWALVPDLLRGWWNVQGSTAVFPGPRNDARLSCLWPLCWLPLLTPGPTYVLVSILPALTSGALILYL